MNHCLKLQTTYPQLPGMSLSNDLALILVSQKYHLSEKIGPICLAQVRENYSSIQVFAAGYGRSVFSSAME